MGLSEEKAKVSTTVTTTRVSADSIAFYIVSPTPSETPSKKRARYSPSRSVGSVDTSYPSQSAHEMSQSGTTTAGGNGKEKDRTVGVIDSDDGRMWLENGRKETKKQMSKRLAEERRVQKREELAERERIKAGLGTGAVVVVPDLKVKKPTGPKRESRWNPYRTLSDPSPVGRQRSRNTNLINTVVYKTTSETPASVNSTARSTPSVINATSSAEPCRMTIVFAFTVGKRRAGMDQKLGMDQDSGPGMRVRTRAPKERGSEVELVR